MNPDILGMSYNSARDELFLADKYNRVVRTTHLRENSGPLLDVYLGSPHDTSPNVYSVCYMKGPDMLLVCSGEKGPNNKLADWLVGLCRNGDKWREEQRVQTAGKGLLCCVLSDLRVLVGNADYNSSKYMELFQVVYSKSRLSILLIHLILVPEEYRWFSAMSDNANETLVAMSFYDQTVRVHRLLGNRLDIFASIMLIDPNSVLWLGNRLIVSELYYETKVYGVIELVVKGTLLEPRNELIDSKARICVRSWCEVSDGLAIFDGKLVELMHWVATKL